MTLRAAAARGRAALIEQDAQEAAEEVLAVIGQEEEAEESRVLHRANGHLRRPPG
ncbi:hypothetical protein [Streptomyces sp. NPDC056480]|uniref:hypothetical protein n=1 Tax=Streptomyces sp. NPDC056480 TaxID=3345833 RepID=UPI003690489D